MIPRFNYLVFAACLLLSACTKVPSPGNSQASTSGIKFYGNQYGNYLSTFGPTSDGGYLFGGYTVNSDSQGQQGFIQKADKNGSLLWYKTYGGTKQDLFWVVRPTSDGGYIAAGTTTSFGNGASLNNNLQDAYIVKTDANGNQQWQKTYGGPSADLFYDVEEAPDHGFVAVGSKAGQFYVVKMDQNGDSLWTRQLFKGYIRSFGASVAFGPNGEVAIAGYEQNKDTQLLGYPSYSYLTPGGTFLIHYMEYNVNVLGYLYNTSGINNSSYIQSFINLSNPICCEKIISRPDGFIFVANDQGFKAIQVFKIDLHGNQLWAKLFTGIGGAVFFNDATNGPDGNLLISGGTYQLNSTKSDYYGWLLNIDGNGNKLMESFLPVPENAWNAGAVFSGAGIGVGINLTTPTNTHANYFGFIRTDKNGKPE